jgi:hypothetical protein
MYLDLYASPNTVRMIKWRRMRWAGHVERVEEMRNAYNTFDGKPERKTSLGRSRRRWEDNIKLDLMEIVWEIAEWLRLSQDIGH